MKRKTDAKQFFLRRDYSWFAKIIPKTENRGMSFRKQIIPERNLFSREENLCEGQSINTENLMECHRKGEETGVVSLIMLDVFWAQALIRRYWLSS